MEDQERLVHRKSSQRSSRAHPTNSRPQSKHPKVKKNLYEYRENHQVNNSEDSDQCQQRENKKNQNKCYNGDKEAVSRRTPQKQNDSHNNTGGRSKRGGVRRHHEADHRHPAISKQQKGGSSNNQKQQEVRFQSSETGELLQHLLGLIEEHSEENEEDPCQANLIFTLPPEAWEEIKKLAAESKKSFNDVSQRWDECFEHQSQELTRWKNKCLQMKNRLDFMKSDCHIQSGEWIVREKQFESSLKQIVHIYDKNRDQLFTDIDDMELAVHKLKNAREKINVQHLGSLTHVEQEMNTLMQNFMTASGKVSMSKLNSARGPNSGENNALEGGPEKSTPRAMIPKPPVNGQIAKRGKSYNPPSERARQSESNKKITIPPLPIQLINKDGGAQNSYRGVQLSNRQVQQMQQQLSNRGLSYRGQGQSSGSQNGQAQPTKRSARPIDSQRSNSVSDPQSEYLLNPVMLGAVGYKTSEFDKNLENDFEGAEQTLPFDTYRLKQYEDEYQMLQAVEDEEQRILLKQWLFFTHERELKKQAKLERHQKMLEKKENKQNLQQLDGTTSRGQNNNQRSNDNEETLKEPSFENRKDKGQRSEESKGSQNDEINISQILGESGLQLDSPLSSFGTNELVKAQLRDSSNQYSDAKLSQLLDVPEGSIGLKTATAKNLIHMIEQNHLKQQLLHQEERRVLDWSSSSGSEQKKEDRAFSQHSNLFNNNAINIIDMQESEDKRASSKLVGDLGQNNAHYEFSSGAVSQMSSHRDLPQRKQRITNGRKSPPQSSEPHCQNQYESSPSNISSERLNFENSGSIIIADDHRARHAVKLPMDPIQERQSEFTNSLGRQQKIINSNRSKSRQQTPSSSYFEGNVVVLTDRNTAQGQKVQSARASSSKKNYKKEHHQFVQWYGQLQQNQSSEEAPHRRPKSHRQSLQSAPNSQRNRIKHCNFSKDLISNRNSFINNFHSIQVEDSLEDDLIQECFSKQGRFNSIKERDQYEAYESQYQSSQLPNEIEPSLVPQLSSRDPDTASLQARSQVSAQKNALINKDKEDVDSKLRKERASQKSSLQSLEELKELAYKEERQLIFKSSSEILLREGQKLYGGQADKSGLRLPNEDPHFNFMEPLSQQKQPSTHIQDIERELLPGPTVQNFNFPSGQQILQGSINESQVIAEGPATANMFSSQTQFTQAQQTRKQLTNNLIAHFLQQQTQNRVQGQSTRDAPTCKKADAKDAGVPLYSFATLSEDTLLQMFPQARRTLQMMQNFQNNYCYNNQAGVLFTSSATDEMNNAFLRQCSTVPSDPNFCSGGIMSQGQINQQHAVNHNTQDSLMNEEQLIQIYNRQFNIPTKQFQMSKIASSTEDSAFKSTNIPARLQALPLQHLNQTKEQNKVTVEPQGVATDDLYQTNQQLRERDPSFSYQVPKGGKREFKQSSHSANRLQLQRTKIRASPNLQLNIRHHDTSNSSNALINSMVTRGSSTRAGNASSILFKGSQDLANISPAAGASLQPASLIGRSSKNQARNNSYQQNFPTQQNLVIKKNSIRISNVSRQNDSDSSFNTNINQSFTANVRRDPAKVGTSMTSIKPNGLRFFDKSKMEEDIVNNL